MKQEIYRLNMHGSRQNTIDSAWVTQWKHVNHAWSSRPHWISYNPCHEMMKRLAATLLVGFILPTEINRHAFAQVCLPKGWCIVESSNHDRVVAYFFEKRSGPIVNGNMNTFLPPMGWVGESTFIVDCSKNIIRVGKNNPWDPIRPGSIFKIISDDLCNRR